MARKTIRQFMVREIDTIIDKKSGPVETEGFVENGALWINLKQNGTSTNNKGQSIKTVKQMGTVLTLQELETVVSAIKKENKKLGVV